MKRPSALLVSSAFLLAGAAFMAMAQTPAAPATKEQKEAAAAIEAPKPFQAPPLPGQVEGGGAAPAPAAKAEAAPAASASKMQALEALTAKPAVQEAPRVSAPSDRIPITSSTSTSGQFIVHGKVFETRSAMSSRCEEISKELRKVLNDKEPWVLPVVVLLNTGEEAGKSKGPPVSTAITEMTHGGFHLQVTVNERPGLNAADLRKEVVRALLAERILRNRKEITTPEGRLLLPDWIMTGVLHAMDYKASARPSALFATIFRSGKIYGIEEIIAASPVEMDGLSRTIYETSCCALVLALVDQPDGAGRFNKFLNALASDPRSERELLNVAFPNFAASSSSLNKWWSLQLAALSKPGVAEPYTPTESLKAIEDAITIRYEAPPAEVPQNVKPRPFVLPGRLAVAPAPAPKPPPPPAAAPEIAASRNPKSAQPQATPPRVENAETPESEDDEPGKKPERKLWRRLLFLGDAEEEKTEDGGTEAPPATKNTASAEDKMPSSKDDSKAPASESSESPEPDEPGFLGRIFGAGSPAKKPDENKEAEKPLPAPKSQAAKVEKPTVPASEAPAPAKEEDKPSKLNPFNWFRGDKKPAAPAKEPESPDGDKKTSLHMPHSLEIARLLSPALADTWGFLAPAAPRPAIDLVPGFLRRKPRPEDEKAAPEPPPPAPAPRPEPPKTASKPRTTNPNARPAAKATPTDAPRTSNPNARPVPPTMAPKTTPPATSSSGSGLVPVALPLEEYKLILKRPDHKAILGGNINALRSLELRVGVLFRPVLSAYMAAITDIQEGRLKDMDKRLAALREFALIAHQKSVAVRDYLDWFEASESGQLSGKFDDFLNLPKIIQEELPPRTDPISKYLDAIDKEFTR